MIFVFFKLSWSPWKGKLNFKELSFHINSNLMFPLGMYLLVCFKPTSAFSLKCWRINKSIPETKSFVSRKWMLSLHLCLQHFSMLLGGIFTKMLCFAQIIVNVKKKNQQLTKDQRSQKIQNYCFQSKHNPAPLSIVVYAYSICRYCIPCY